MKVDDLIEKLERFKGYNIRFDIDCVNLNLEKPYKYFPYTESVEDLCINDVAEDGKTVCLGYNENIYFHRVLELEK